MIYDNILANFASISRLRILTRKVKFCFILLQEYPYHKLDTFVTSSIEVLQENNENFNREKEILLRGSGNTDNI